MVVMTGDFVDQLSAADMRGQDEVLFVQEIEGAVNCRFCEPGQALSGAVIDLRLAKGGWQPHARFARSPDAGGSCESRGRVIRWYNNFP